MLILITFTNVNIIIHNLSNQIKPQLFIMKFENYLHCLSIRGSFIRRLKGI